MDIEFNSESDDNVIESIVDHLELSFQHRQDPFHPAHDELGSIRDRLDEKGRRHLFAKAFDRFDKKASHERQNREE